MKLLVIGATGLVGKNLLKLLEKNELNIEKYCFVSSMKNRNKSIIFLDKVYVIKCINDINLSDYTHACILTKSDVSKQITPSLLFNNVVVIDNSSAYRNCHSLTIPELNFKPNKRMYVNPNCCIIQSLIPLFTIEKKYEITNIFYNTYQSCSGGGKQLLDDFNNNKLLNCIPEIGFYIDDNTDEEVKLITETKKILNKNINVFASCVRVPTAIGHLVNITFECKNSDFNSIEKILNECTIYSKKVNIKDITNDFNVYTFRLKQLTKNTYSFYSFANNLLRGSSYNSYLTLKQIISNSN